MHTAMEMFAICTVLAIVWCTLSLYSVHCHCMMYIVIVQCTLCGVHYLCMQQWNCFLCAQCLPLYGEEVCVSCLKAGGVNPPRFCVLQDIAGRALALCGSVDGAKNLILHIIQTHNGFPKFPGRGLNSILCCWLSISMFCVVISVEWFFEFCFCYFGSVIGYHKMRLDAKMTSLIVIFIHAYVHTNIINISENNLH